MKLIPEETIDMSIVVSAVHNKHHSNSIREYYLTDILEKIMTSHSGCDFSTMLIVIEWFYLDTLSYIFTALVCTQSAPL
jgi:hypothetical protein